MENTIIVKTQKDFDSIESDFKGRIEIRDTTEFISVGRSFNNAYITVSGSATIKSVYDSATIKYVYDSATIKSVSGSATIESVSDSATIKSVYDSATIKSVSGSATIKYVSGSATIKYVSGSATIESVSGSATIKSVYDSATIKSVSGSATIKSVSGSATIEYVYDSATIEYVSGSATIKSVYGSATIKYVSGSATIKYVSGSATIKYVSGSATIESVSGSATIKSVYDSATIESVYDSATICLMTGLASIVLLYSAKKIVARGMNLIRQIGTKKIDIEMSKSVSYVQLKETIENTPTFEMFTKLYPVEYTKTKAKLYKAVHKIDGKYIADYDRKTEYEIGKTLEIPCDNSNTDSCSYGIHLSHLRWAYLFGKNWEDLAILECETNIKDIVVSTDCDGKLRTSKCKVLRELNKDEYEA